MKTIWTAISFLAVVHLLAVLMFIGWLYQSNRLDTARIEHIRTLLAPTIAEEQAGLEQAAAEAEIAAAQAFEQARQDSPQPPSAEKIDYLTRLEQSDLDRSRRIQEELDDLRLQLALAQRSLETERAAFSAQRETWEQEREALAAQQSDAQFQRVVKMLESIPSKQAKDVLVTLVDDGKTEDAVAYLNAMKPYSASKVLKEFKSEEEKALATNLLQRMKVLGAAGLSRGAEAGDSLDAASPPSG